MTARDNNQPRGGGTILPGFGELVQNLEAAQTRLPRIDFGSSSSWAHTGARPHSEGATSPYNYTHSQPGRPLWETRDRLEDWRREQGHSVPRRYPTPPRDAPPPAITSAYEAQRQPYNDADIYDSHRGNSGRQGSYDHGPYNHARSSISGHNQGSLPSPRYSQPAAGYRPRSGESGYSSQEVVYSPQAYSGGHHHAGFSTASPGGGGGGYHHHSPSSYHSAAPPSSSGGGEHQRGRKRSTAHEEAEDAGRKRRNFPQPIINILKKWAVKRIDDLKFSQEEKDEIVRETGLDRNQVTGWYINYHRRGWAQDRWDHYKSRLSDAEAAFHAAVAEARRAADMGGDGGEEAARRAADAEAARLDALVEELGAKERLARKELEEHKSKKRGGC